MSIVAGVFFTTIYTIIIIIYARKTRLLVARRRRYLCTRAAHLKYIIATVREVYDAVWKI